MWQLLGSSVMFQFSVIVGSGGRRCVWKCYKCVPNTSNFYDLIVADCNWSVHDPVYDESDRVECMCTLLSSGQYVRLF